MARRNKKIAAAQPSPKEVAESPAGERAGGGNAKANSTGARYLVILLLLVTTLVVYWRAGSNGFVNYDDPRYVTGNPHVRTGVTAENIRWAFTTTEMGNWHPVTWLSHTVDSQLYGLSPRGHHLTSVSLHAVSAILLFLLLADLTGALWRSALVAALFALHPLHVESVAWVAERKDVLSTLFFMSALLAYARYARRSGPVWYAALLVTFTLGLMSKPMLVTLPLLLLLLDVWPLERFRKVPLSRLVLEKAPLFALAAVSSVVTIRAQESGKALATLETLPFATRLSNALVSYVGYVGKTIWPNKLAVLYPLPADVPVWQASAAALLLAAVSAALFLGARRRPFLLVGWLWYLGTLVPVIGIVQVGIQAMADRYTYIPLIGLFIMIAWSIPDLEGERRRYRGAAVVLAAVILTSLSALTWRQIGYWKSSQELFAHALESTTGNYMAHLNLGIALGEQGNLDEAARHFNESLRIRPNFAMADYNLGNALLLQGRVDEAVRHFNDALRKNPGYAQAHYKLGAVLAGQGKTAEAIGHYQDALRSDPDLAKAHSGLGAALAEQGRFAEAMTQYAEALRLDPGDATARANMESVQARAGASR